MTSKKKPSKRTVKKIRAWAVVNDDDEITLNDARYSKVLHLQIARTRKDAVALRGAFRYLKVVPVLITFSSPKSKKR